MAKELNIKALMQRHESLKRKKEFWFPLYQALSQYVMMRKQYFTTESPEGPFTINQTFDATALHAAHLTASSLLGQILPSPGESFEFLSAIAQSEQVWSDIQDMMDTVNEVLPANMAQPEAGLMTSVHEVLIDLVVYGIAAVSLIEQEDINIPVITKSVDAKMMTISENEAGQVDTVYLEKKMTIGQLVQKYGYDNVSERSKAAYDSEKLDEEVKVLHCIEPRRERNPLNLGVKDMPFASIHIEVDQKHCLLESGYEELPIIVVRFWKNVGETQGRSPAMDALPDIRAVNKLVEMFEKAGELGLDPPRMISTEDVLGAGKIPWGPGVNIPTHRSGRLGSDRPAVEVIQVTQNPGWATQRISDLRDNIQQYFMNNQLTDLNNRSRQTLGEANIRLEKGMFVTGPMLNRCLIELLTPLLNRWFNILLSKGYFGVVRGSVQDLRMQAAGYSPKYISEDFISQRMAGLKGYRINFISPAARLMKLEEAQGLQEVVAFAQQVGTINPASMDVVKWDEAVRMSPRLFGASNKLINSIEEVDEIRRAKAMQAQAMQEAQMEMAQAQTFSTAAKGVKDIGNIAA